MKHSRESIVFKKQAWVITAGCTDILMVFYTFNIVAFVYIQASFIDSFVNNSVEPKFKSDVGFSFSKGTVPTVQSHLPLPHFVCVQYVPSSANLLSSIQFSYI